MPTIAVSCRSCGSKRTVPDHEICWGVRCRKCEQFMEAERNTQLEDLDWLGRKRVRQLTPLAKMWLLLMLLGSLAAPLVLLLWNKLDATAEPKIFILTGVVVVTLSALNIVFIVALLNLKKWGFYALAGFAVVDAVFAILIGVWPAALADAARIAILFGALKAGQPDSWSQLR
jgi:hypothetical protein